MKIYIRQYIFLLLIFFSLVLPVQAGENIILAKVSATINPTIKDYIKGAIKRAEKESAEALIIELDTPGGLETSMRSIVKEILSSEVPIIVYVSPKGARAGSAGVFITIAAHIAAMAPGTNMGSAHPVSIGGGEAKDSVMSQKVAEDAKAFIRSIAELRGRNIQVAQEMVEKSISLTEKEAFEKQLIDLVPDDLNSLLKAINGKKVKTTLGERILNTQNKTIINFEMSFKHRILDIIANPTVAYLLMILAIYAIIYELASPGGYVAGVVGLILLILSLYALQILEVNFAGIIMVIIGVTLIILEAFIFSHGLLGLGGIISLVIGFIMLFEPKDINIASIMLKMLPLLILISLLFFLAVRTARKALKRKSPLGMEALIGEEGLARSEITSKGGWVLVQGELWSAFSDEPISADEPVIIESYKGLKLKVRKGN